MDGDKMTTFEQWWDKKANAGSIMFINDDEKCMARVAWEAAMFEAAKRIHNSDIGAIYGETYCEAEWEEMGSNCWDEILSVIGDK